LVMPGPPGAQLGGGRLLLESAELDELLEVVLVLEVELLLESNVPPSRNPPESPLECVEALASPPASPDAPAIVRPPHPRTHASHAAPRVAAGPRLQVALQGPSTAPPPRSWASGAAKAE
jgi:hypothetical protein